MQPGPRNLITDVEGMLVGQAQDDAVKSGVTVLTSERRFTAAVEVMGGAPGTRETDLLSPGRLVGQVDALVLSGGSAFGLDAAGGVVAALRAAGRGFDVGEMRVPIVPAAILFDLINGGDKGWGENPYPAMGRAAFAAVGRDFVLGTAGAGTGATAGGLKGGLGSASLKLQDYTIGALVAVNPSGSVTLGAGPHFWAAPFELGEEFGGIGPAPGGLPPDLPELPVTAGTNTTIAIVATDAALDQAQAQRLATAAHAGMARAIVPSHTIIDGDLVFAASTGARPLRDPVATQFLLGQAAALCLSRAVARGIFHARAAPGDLRPCWQDFHGQGRGGGV